MCAERFGSYSIAATFAGTPSLRRLKSILRYVRVAPAGLLQPLRERLLGLVLRDGLVLEERREAPSGRGGLVLLDCHRYSVPIAVGAGATICGVIRTTPDPRRARSSPPDGASRPPSSTCAGVRSTGRGALASA